MARITTLNAPNVHLVALDAALRAALPGKVFGVNASLGSNGLVRIINNPPPNGDGQTILGQFQVLLDDATTGGDDTTAQNTATAHDPVFLTYDKNQVQADGSDTATITVNAPKQGAAACTLVCTKPDGSQITQAVTMTNGAGTVQFKSAIPGTYTITLQSPANRTTDVITIQAV